MGTRCTRGALHPSLATGIPMHCTPPAMGPSLKVDWPLRWTSYSHFNVNLSRSFCKQRIEKCLAAESLQKAVNLGETLHYMQILNNQARLICMVKSFRLTGFPAGCFLWINTSSANTTRNTHLRNKALTFREKEVGPYFAHLLYT